MPRGEKGILGYRKDPKKQILFSFTARKGDDWPSDESDEDYVPALEKANTENEVSPPIRENKRKKIRPAHDHKMSPPGSEEPHPKRQQKDSSRNSKSVERNLNKGHADDVWGSLMPPEVLHKIFQVVVGSEGSVPFLVRAQRVCHLWHEVASDRSLWTKVDLSFGWVKKLPNLLLRLCDAKLPKVKHLNLTGWQKLNGDSLKVIGSKCPKLKSLNLTQCKKVTGSSVHDLIDSCPSLTALNLSDVTSDVHSFKSLSIVLEKCGENLKELSLSHNRVLGFSTTVRSIASTCGSLEVLDLSHMTFQSDYLSICFESLQQGCPLLRVLNLNGTLIRASSNSVVPKAPPVNGFVHLEELHLAGQGLSLNTLTLNADYATILRTILWNSYKLRVLDIRNNTGRIADDIYHHIPLSSLQYLYASRCELVKEEDFWRVLEKCRNTLEELHIEWASYSESSNERALQTLAEVPGTSKLRVLNATGNVLASTAVRAILNGCPKLESLDLSSCRGLPRGVKRLYSGSKQLCKLKEILDDASDVD